SWVFTLSDYKPTLEASKDKSVEADMKTKDEMISYLSNFEEKYPVKQVDTGLVTFITIENKEVLLAEISDQDIRMLENISDAVIEESLSKRNEVLVSNWTSGVNGAPNMHEDMARWAAEKAGFNSSMSNRIGSYADEPDDPDNMTYDSDVSSNNGLWPALLEKIIESNYYHYYNPSLNLGDAIDRITIYLQRAMITSSPVNQRAVNLSYASHFVCDMSMPLHTDDAALQAAYNQSNALLYTNWPEPHLMYENDYVGPNWTGGLKFGSVAENANYAYGTANPIAHSKVLAAYSHSYSSTVWDCMVDYDFDNRTLELVTDRCLFEGQAALNGLMLYGNNNGI
ncbi:MAG: hypothetical protein LBU81_06160, partial [Methanosarcinales archaeon]|nr:hypothetical protein [Methanosarcinales archaeon]